MWSECFFEDGGDSVGIVAGVDYASLWIKEHDERDATDLIGLGDAFRVRLVGPQLCPFHFLMIHGLAPGGFGAVERHGYKFHFVAIFLVELAHMGDGGAAGATP